MLRGEPGVYYEDLYPLVCFLPRYSTHAPEVACEEDMLPMWKASAMDADKHRTAHTLTSSRPMSPDGNGSGSRGSGEQAEKDLSALSEDQIYHSMRGRQQRKKKFDPEAALPVVYSEHPLLPARNPPKESVFDYLPFLRIFKILSRPFRKSQPVLPTAAAVAPTRSLTGKRIQPEAVDSNVPLEITLFLSSYLAWLLRNGQLQPALATAFTNGISQLQDVVTNLDRIRNTPLPFAYQAHLRISLWLYLFFLPVSLRGVVRGGVVADSVRHFSSKSGARSDTSLSRACSCFIGDEVCSSALTAGMGLGRATAFVAFLLLGFLEIGQEMYVWPPGSSYACAYKPSTCSENPFDYDKNDLGEHPADNFLSPCSDIAYAALQTSMRSASRFSASCTRSRQYVSSPPLFTPSLLT